MLAKHTQRHMKKSFEDNVLDDETLKNPARLIVAIIKNLVSRHKLPWTIDPRKNSKLFTIRDDWGKIIMPFIEQDIAEQVVKIATSIVEKYKEEHTGENSQYSTLLKLWKERQQELRKIDRAIELEDDNFIKNFSLTS